MSEEQSKPGGRRGFLGGLFASIAAIGTASAAEAAISEASSEQPETVNFSDLFNRKNWLSWKQLRDKLKNGDRLTDFEVYQTAWYMQASSNLPLIMKTYGLAQKPSNDGKIHNLIRLHPLVKHRIVAIATNKELFRGSPACPNGIIPEPNEDDEILSEQDLNFTRPR